MTYDQPLACPMASAAAAVISSASREPAEIARTRLSSIWRSFSRETSRVNRRLALVSTVIVQMTAASVPARVATAAVMSPSRRSIPPTPAALRAARAPKAAAQHARAAEVITSRSRSPRERWRAAVQAATASTAATSPFARIVRRTKLGWT